MWDERGQSLADRPEVRGELVCPDPFPSMPLEFFGDDGSKYHDGLLRPLSDGVWAQGDFASRTEHGGFIIHGRSDATLNAGGVRIGTAEIYRQVEQLPQVLEALAIGQDWDGDTRIVLFLRLADGATLDDELAALIRTRLRQQCSPRHVPARIVAVADLPRTRSGKLAELAVADVVNGRRCATWVRWQIRSRCSSSRALSNLVPSGAPVPRLARRGSSCGGTVSALPAGQFEAAFAQGPIAPRSFAGGHDKRNVHGRRAGRELRAVESTQAMAVIRAGPSSSSGSHSNWSEPRPIRGSCIMC